MRGNELIAFEDPDLVGHAMGLDRSATSGVRNRVVVAADAHHAFAADTAIKLENGAERDQRQGLQRRALLGERFVYDTACGRMQARIGNVARPVVELAIEILQVAEDTAKEEVLTDIAEWRLDLAFVSGRYGLQALDRNP